MGKFIKIGDSTIVTGVTSTGSYFVGKINSRQVGIPLFTFSYSQPDLDFVSLVKTDIDVSNATIYTGATSYGAGVATTIGTSSFAIPLYKIDQNVDVAPQLLFHSPTVVSDLEYTGNYIAMRVNGEIYGTPIVNYTSLYPFTTTVAMSSISISTALEIGAPVVNDNQDRQISTYLNPKITTYNALIKRAKGNLGWPSIKIEICDETIVDFIDQALEFYTKYTGWTEEYLLFNSNIYEKGVGIKMDKLFTITPEQYKTNAFNISASYDYDLGDYRKVIDCFSFESGEAGGINTLFTLEQAMAQQTYFSYMLGNAGFDLVTWDILKGWLKIREKVLAQKVYFRFSADEQTLRLLPEPLDNSMYSAVIGCHVEKPIKYLIKERWIWQYVLALLKIALGNVRGKYNMTLFGGGTITYNELLSQGIAEKQALEDEI